MPDSVFSVDLPSLDFSSLPSPLSGKNLPHPNSKASSKRVLSKNKNLSYHSTYLLGAFSIEILAPIVPALTRFKKQYIMLLNVKYFVPNDNGFVAKRNDISVL